MTINEVYALNIQSRQIIERIKCKKEDKKAIEKERGNFLKFLDKSGHNFSSQEDAWRFYDGQNIGDVYDETDYEELLDSVQNSMDRELVDIETKAWLDQKEPDWSSRARYQLYKKAEILGAYEIDMDNPFYSTLNGGDERFKPNMNKIPGYKVRVR
jgi:hypothetical protein